MKRQIDNLSTQTKKSRILVFIFGLISLAFFSLNLHNAPFEVKKAQGAAFQPLTVTVTIPPTIDLTPTNVQGQINTILSGAPQAPFDYPNLFPDYYNFAKIRLFDYQEFFVIDTGYTPIPGLILTKSGPQHVDNGKDISYTITANYTGTDQSLLNSIVLSDAIPTGSKFVSADGHYTNSNNIIYWNLKDNGKNPFTFHLTVHPTSNDTSIKNILYATISGAYNSQGNNIRWLYSGADLNPQGKNLGGNQFQTNDGKNHPDWVSAQCAGASLTEIFNAYKNPTDTQFRTAEILNTMHTTLDGGWPVWIPGDETNNAHPVGGLQDGQVGIGLITDKYGFHADYQTYTISAPNTGHLIDLAQNKHHPIMISAPGHWLVLWGADPTWETDPSGNHIWLLDSSGNFLTWDPNYPNGWYGKNLTSVKMSLNTFIGGYWTGIGVEIVPKALPSPTIKSTAPSPSPTQLPPQNDCVDASGKYQCLCDHPWGMPVSDGVFQSAQNDFESISAHRWCADNQYCDPRIKSGGYPCTNITNSICKCTGQNSYSCTNSGGQTLSRSCPNNGTCDTSVKNYPPCK